jgi:hypothetical protein
MVEDDMLDAKTVLESLMYWVSEDDIHTFMRLNDLLWDEEDENEDDEEIEDVDESLKEDWYHFEYKSGANPYIAKTEKERDRILRKYKNRVTKKDENTFVIDDTEKDLFMIDEDFSERPIATMGLTNTSGIGIYDLNDEEVTYAFFDGSEEEPIKQTATIEYDCEDEDCRPYFSFGDTKLFLDDFMRITESKSCNLKKKNLNEAEDEEDEYTVYDLLNDRLFGYGINKSNFRLKWKFAEVEPVISTKDGKTKKGYFYPTAHDDNLTTGKQGDRRAFSDEGIGVFVYNEDEALLAKKCAEELNLGFVLRKLERPINGFNYIATIKVPDDVQEMPVKDYVESIGKSMSDFLRGKGEKARSDFKDSANYKFRKDRKENK